MKIQKHTPGPWILEQDTVFIGETRKVQPVLYHGDSKGMANARLIAAAPDLLDAVQAMVDAFGDQDSILIDQCKAALNKATGKQ